MQTVMAGTHSDGRKRMERTTELIPKVLYLWDSGYGIRAVAKRTHMACATVREILKDNERI